MTALRRELRHIEDRDHQGETSCPAPAPTPGHPIRATRPPGPRSRRRGGHRRRGRRSAHRSRRGGHRYQSGTRLGVEPSAARAALRCGLQPVQRHRRASAAAAPRGLPAGRLLGLQRRPAEQPGQGGGHRSRLRPDHEGQLHSRSGLLQQGRPDRGGQIAAQGISSTAPTKRLAVVGGTGEYTGASGYLELVENGNGTGRLTLVLR
jgi:hypothetical protein